MEIFKIRPELEILWAAPWDKSNLIDKTIKEWLAVPEGKRRVCDKTIKLWLAMYSKKKTFTKAETERLDKIWRLMVDQIEEWGKG